MKSAVLDRHPAYVAPSPQAAPAPAVRVPKSHRAGAQQSPRAYEGRHVAAEAPRHREPLLRKIGDFILRRNRTAAGRAHVQLPDAMPAQVAPRRHAAEMPVVVGAVASQQLAPQPRVYRSRAARPPRGALTQPQSAAAQRPDPSSAENAAAAVAEQQRAPITPRLHYEAGEFQALAPRENGALSTHGMVARHNETPLLNRQPLLTAEQVAEQLGPDMGLGALQSVVHLPGAKEPLYLFNQTTQDEAHNPQWRFMLAGPTQLGKIRTHRDIGQPSREEIDNEVLALAIPEGRQVYTATVGAAGLVSGRKNNAPQTTFVLNREGSLSVFDHETERPTVIETSHHLVPQQDPWPGGPAESGEGAYVQDVPPEWRHNNPPHEHIGL